MISPTTGIEPPSRMNTGFLPKPASMARTAARTAGVSVLTRTAGAVMGQNLVGDPGRAHLRHVVAELPLDALRVLIGDQAEAELRAGLARQDGLGPGPGITAEDPVDVTRRSGPFPLERRVAGLALQARHRQIGLKGGLGERKRGKLGPLPRCQWPYLVVETREPDLAVSVLQAGENRRQRVQRVCDRAAVGSRVQVAVGPLDEKLEVRQAFQAIGDRRLPGATGCCRK